MAKTMKDPKENRHEHRTNKFPKAKSVLKRKGEGTCDMEEDGTKMSIVLTVQTGLCPGVCGPLKIA